LIARDARADGIVFLIPPGRGRRVGETLTATRTCAGHVAASAQAVRSTYCPIGSIRPVSAATGTKCLIIPRARLHVLTVGISEYGGKAGNLRLNFAARDAQDVASALLNTQEGGLYAQVKPMFLPDDAADREGIFEAFAGSQHDEQRRPGSGGGHVLRSRNHDR
jgi:hypothetical protein